MPDQIVNFSGGKDSTALLHMMLARREPIAAVVYFDTGWEFPEINDHLIEVERKTGLTITRLAPEEPFDRWLTARPIRSMQDRPKEGIPKGAIHKIGLGWPTPNRRWCTANKRDRLDRYASWFTAPVQLIGIASDERQRIPPAAPRKWPRRYPLVEWGVTEAAALEYCRQLGYTWGGLYELFDRVSCYTCPLGGKTKMRVLRKHRPVLWQRILDLDRRIPPPNRGFIKYETAHDLERQFALEDAQCSLFE